MWAHDNFAIRSRDRWKMRASIHRSETVSDSLSEVEIDRSFVLVAPPFQ